VSNEAPNVFAAKIYQLMSSGNFTQAISLVRTRDMEMVQQAKTAHTDRVADASATLREIAALAEGWESE
jgi:hypothetical protein